jgi:hypothetical protein
MSTLRALSVRHTGAQHLRKLISDIDGSCRGELMGRRAARFIFGYQSLRTKALSADCVRADCSPAIGAEKKSLSVRSTFVARTFRGERLSVPIFP